jgi:hypothetical protein
MSVGYFVKSMPLERCITIALCMNGGYFIKSMPLERYITIAFNDVI